MIEQQSASSMLPFDTNRFLYKIRKQQQPVDEEAQQKSTSSGRVKPYDEVLEMTRAYISEHHSSALADVMDNENAKDLLRGLIQRYIQQEGVTVRDEPDMIKLVERIYNNMADFACISPYLLDPKVEEINANSYNDIEIVTEDGWYKLDEHFSSPEESVLIAQRLARMGKITLNESEPICDSEIKRGVRVSIAIPPVMDEKYGAAFSIRKQSERAFSPTEVVRRGTAIQDELDLMTLLVNNRVSLGVAGATSSGKTTDMSVVLANSQGKRIFTIEEGASELNLVTTDPDTGKVTSRVVQTRTRKHDNPRYNITADDLLRLSLRFHPDISVPAEMRGKEAMTAQEVARTGHGVITSLHSNTVKQAYTRILTMAMMSGTKLSEDLMMQLLVEAFPVMVFKRQLPDRSRKYMSIFEATGYENKRILGHYLYKFVISGQVKKPDGSGIEKVLGSHQRRSTISDRLANQLLEGGADIPEIKRFAADDWEPGKDGEYDV